MSKVKIEVPVKALNAASGVIDGKDARRPNLNTVAVDVTEDDIILVVTDGHVEFATRIGDNDSQIDPGIFLLPIDEVKSVVKEAKNNILIDLEVEDDEFVFRIGNKIRGGKLVDLKYPEWRKVIPDNPSGEVAAFNPQLVERLVKAIAIAEGQSTTTKGKDIIALNLVPNGNKTAAIAVGNSIGVVMPIKGYTGEFNKPAWAGREGQWI